MNKISMLINKLIIFSGKSLFHFTSQISETVCVPQIIPFHSLLFAFRCDLKIQH